MNAKQVGGIALTIVALIICIGSMATLAWITAENDNGNGSKTTTNIGLKRYSMVTVDGDNTYTTSGDIAGSSLSGASNLDAGGNNVLATGCVALVLIVGGVVAYVLYNRRTLGVGALVGAIFCELGAAVLIVAGMMLYARKINLGYSFVVYLLGALLFLTATCVLIMAAITEANKPQKYMLGGFLTLGAVVVVCVGLGTVVWLQAFSSDGSCEIDYGVKAWRTVCSANGNTVTENHSSFSDIQPDEFRAKLTDAGNYAIGFGVVGLLFGVASIVMTVLVLAEKKGPVSFPVMTVLAVLLAAVFIVIGNCLYAKQFNVGYSFMAFISSAFVVLLGLAVMLGGVFSDPAEAGTLGVKTTAASAVARTDPTKHQRLRDDNSTCV